MSRKTYPGLVMRPGKGVPVCRSRSEPLRSRSIGLCLSQVQFVLIVPNVPNVFERFERLEQLERLEPNHDEARPLTYFGGESGP